MDRICPQPRVWVDIYTKLTKISDKNPAIPKPPLPIILGGWWCTGDLEKALQWDATLRWINLYGDKELISKLTDEDFHRVIKYRRPLEENWSYQLVPPAEKYSEEKLKELLISIENNWDDIAGHLANRCKPIRFSGKKSRCLNVQIYYLDPPPWGTWGIEKINYRNQNFTNKKEFTNFREKINAFLKPHKIDHVKFFYKNFSIV